MCVAEASTIKEGMACNSPVSSHRSLPSSRIVPGFQIPDLRDTRALHLVQDSWKPHSRNPGKVLPLGGRVEDDSFEYAGLALRIRLKEMTTKRSMQ
jgi:hypothetical protein